MAKGEDNILEMGLGAFLRQRAAKVGGRAVITPRNDGAAISYADLRDPEKLQNAA